MVVRERKVHKSEEYLDAYLRTAGIADQKGTPLWRSMTKERELSDIRMNRQDVFRMIKRRCHETELGAAANCHTFRATGITAYLLNGGTLEHAQAIAAHESPRTTKLYDARPMKLPSMTSSASEFSAIVARLLAATTAQRFGSDADTSSKWRVHGRRVSEEAPKICIRDGADCHNL